MPMYLPSFLGRRLSCHDDSLGLEQYQFPFRANGKRMHVEVGFPTIGCLHDGRGRGYDRNLPALPDPIDVPMAVHDHDAARQALQ
jgi:hypothetical protein